MTASTAADSRRWKALAVLGIAYLMVLLDASVVNVALPSIEKELGFSPENLQWVVSAYALTFGGLLLLGGRVGDLLGRRRLFMVGLAAFGCASLLCGLSVSSEMLIGARALQGIGGAILSPSVFSIVTVTFEEGAERNKALGILGAIAGSGAAIGVLLGGVLTEYAGWEWIFLINVPIAVIALLVTRRYVRESRAEVDERRFDAAGAITITTGLLLLVYGLTQAPNNGWASWETIGVLLGFAALIASAILIEAKSRWPLVPLRFFRKRTPTAANLVGFGLGTMTVGMFFLLSLYMQQVLGYSALRAGIAFLAVALTAIASSGIAQALATRITVKPVLIAGLVLVGGGLLYLTQISPDGSYVSDLLPGFLVLGVGLGCSFVPVSIAALSGIEQEEAGLASGLINSSQQIGGALGVAILTTVSTSRTSSLIEQGTLPPVALTDGFSLAFWVATGLAAASILTALVAIRRSDLRSQPAGVPIA